jgi:hypothetical protein
MSACPFWVRVCCSFRDDSERCARVNPNRIREGVVLHGAGPGPAQRGVEIARLLFVVDKIPKHERDRVRRDLLDYCHRDALAMVRLVETLEGLARVAP